MRELQFRKPLLSAYYFATVFFYFLITQLTVLKEFTAEMQLWLNDLVNTADAQNSITQEAQAWIPWSSMILAGFVVIFLFKNFIIEPLELRIRDTYTSPFEIAFLIILVFGSMIYLINQVFLTQNMPALSPDFVVKLFGGVSQNVNRLESDKWTFVPWLWVLGPLLYIYILDKKYKHEE